MKNLLVRLAIVLALALAFGCAPKREQAPQASGAPTTGQKTT